MTMQDVSIIRPDVSQDPLDVSQGWPAAGNLVFRFLVTVDAEGFSQCCAAEQASIQRDLGRALTLAAEALNMDRDQWDCQPRGDGELAELPPSVDGLSLVADFPRELAAVISGINAAREAGPRLRVRMAIHHGAVSPGPFGSVGFAPVLVSRLVDAGVVRQQLRDEPDRDLALIVSAAVYQEVIKTRFHGLCPDDFRRVTVHAKRVAYVGYLHLRAFDRTSKSRPPRPSRPAELGPAGRS